MEGNDGIAAPVAYDLKTAAAAVGLCGKTVRRLIESGELSAARVGSKILVPRAELEAFIARKAAEPLESYPIGRGSPNYPERVR